MAGWRPFASLRRDLRNHGFAGVSAPMDQRCEGFATMMFRGIGTESLEFGWFRIKVGWLSDSAE